MIITLFVIIYDGETMEHRGAESRVYTGRKGLKGDGKNAVVAVERHIVARTIFDSFSGFTAVSAECSF